jgi:hypothetical protein
MQFRSATVRRVPTRAGEQGLAAQADCRKCFLYPRIAEEILGLYDSFVSGKRVTDSGLRADRQDP